MREMNLGDAATILASNLPDGWRFPQGTRLSMRGVYSFLLETPDGETIKVSLEKHERRTTSQMVRK